MDDDQLNNQSAASSRPKKVIQPLSHGQDQASGAETSQPDSGANPAAEVIRKKIESLYASDTAGKAQPDTAGTARRYSKHQEYMQRLSTSGKSLAEIQTAWHNYYVSLSDAEKHEVWQEFYRNHGRNPALASPATAAKDQTDAPRPEEPAQTPPQAPDTQRSTAEIKSQLLNKVNSRSKLKAKHHFQSILFGLGMGSLVMLVLLFGFFNERFIAPFITPSRVVSSTPIIIDPNDTSAVSKEPKVIIPKINVEIPVVYDEPSVQEDAVQKALERGVVHYATTENPGEKGNAVIFGHSSNNILNRGQYKFAFVLLHKLEVGDTFYLHFEGTRYAYRVFEKKVVDPTEIGVLNDHADKPATATLITCDPPGTALKRLVVVGEQITPDPATNTASSAIEPDDDPAILPSNAPSLWDRITDWF